MVVLVAVAVHKVTVEPRALVDHKDTVVGVRVATVIPGAIET